MAFTAQDVKELRESTGCGMMDCKKALTEADGDMEKAVALLREKGLAAANKKAGRIASEGIVCSITDADTQAGAMVEVNSETDFVAKNESFREFVQQLAEVVLKNDPADVDALLKLPMNDRTVEAELQEKILVIGENLKIRRFVRFSGINCSYVHSGGTHGVLVQFDTSDDVAKSPEFAAFAKDVAMHITVFNPPYMRREDVPAEILDKEKEILKTQAINEGKPENIAEKMVIGRINKYYEQNCLLEQKFVRDDKISVQQYVDDTAKKLGGDIKVLGFARYEKGEGLEKKEEDFASEVAGMMK